jgi:CRP-like cAMP-binding protein
LLSELAPGQGRVLLSAWRRAARVRFRGIGPAACFVSDAEGNEYNKIFFEERSFPGPMAALLESRPSAVALQALEDSLLVAIDFAGFRALLERSPDLMWFQIRYLERNWLLMKEPREFALVQDEAAQRYRRFKQDSPGLAERLPLFHIASHLGITPTQLSRIRRAERGESGA